MRPTQLRFIGLIASLLLVPGTAGANTDVWSTPFPGIRHLHRTGPNNLNAHGAVVDLCAPGVSVRHTDFTERRKRTSTQASSVGAQWAINADWSCRPIDVNPATSPFAPCIGQPEYMTYGIAAHAGRQWPNPYFRDALLAFGPGRVEIYDYWTRKEFEPGWMLEALSGHWTLVIDGRISTSGEMAQCPREPRTAIGLSQDRTKLILAVVDGRHGRRGMNCDEMASFLIELGAHNGFGLDGGGSSTMWSAARGVLNVPSDLTSSGSPGAERIVGPHLAIYASGSGPAPFCDRPFATDPSSPLPALVPLGEPGLYRAYVPSRLFDTRSAAGSAGLQGLLRDAQGRVRADSTITFDGFSSHGVPADATAVVVNTTATGAESAGYATVFAAQLPRPEASSLNYPADASRANTAVSGLDASQRLSLYTFSAAHFIADLQGAFSPASGAGYAPQAPVRLLDTRQGVMLATDVPRRIVDPAPPDVEAMALGVAAVSPAADGFVTVYPCDQPVPNASNLNFRQGQNIAATVLARAGPQGICAVSSTPTHLIVDLSGTFRTGARLGFQAVAPARLVDTRQPTGRWVGRVTPGTPAVLELGRLPAGVEAVVVNLTSTGATDNGFLKLYPCNIASPDTSSLNFRADSSAVANAVVVGTGAGSLCLETSARTHVIIDLMGYFVPMPELPDAGSSTDAGGAASDAGVPIDLPDASEAAPDAADAATPSVDAGAVQRDGGEVAPADAGPGPDWTALEDGAGCSCASQPLSLLALAGLALIRRRRSRPQFSSAPPAAHAAFAPKEIP